MKKLLLREIPLILAVFLALCLTPLSTAALAQDDGSPVKPEINLPTTAQAAYSAQWTSASAIRLTVTPQKAGTVYYRVADGEPEMPTAAALISAGQAKTCAAGSPTVIDVSGLSALAKSVDVVYRDADGALYAVDRLALPAYQEDAAAVIGQASAAGAVTFTALRTSDGQIQLTIRPTVSGVCYYLVRDSAEESPDAGQVLNEGTAVPCQAGEATVQTIDHRTAAEKTLYLRFNAGGKVLDGMTVMIVPAYSTGAYSASLDAYDPDFGVTLSGDPGRPAAKTLTIKNRGTEPLHFVLQQGSSDYEIDVSGIDAIPAGKTGTFTVQPKAGLAVGPHNAELVLKATPQDDASRTLFTLPVSLTYTVRDPAAPNGGFKLVGYHAGSSLPYPCQVQNTADLADVETVYCINIGHDVAAGSTIPYFTKIGGAAAEDVDRYSGCSQHPHPYSPEQLADYLRLVMYYGYPNDHDGLITTLTGNNSYAKKIEFSWITQSAIWHYVDPEGSDTLDDYLHHHLSGPNYKITKAMRDIYDRLTSFDLNGETEQAVIHSVQLDLFINGYTQTGGDHNGERYQNLMGAKFSAPSQASVKLKITGTKKLDGSTSLGSHEFLFNLVDSTGSVVETVHSLSDGSIEFSPLTYTQPGTYSYTIREVNDGQAGISYSEDIYHVSVEVRQDNGVMEISATYVRNGDVVEDITFENTTVQSIQVPLTAEKQLDGAAPSAEYDGAFTFELYKGTTASGTPLQTRTNTGGTVAFDDLTFSSNGVYHYIVKEKAGSDDTIVYDSREYRVDITVTPSGSGLSAAVEYYLGTTKQDRLLFENRHLQVSVPLTATKTMNGLTPASNSFVFDLYEGNTASGTPLQTKNNAGGTVTFDPLVFTTPGTYTYTVAEQNGGVSGITYDNAVYTAVIVVTRVDDELQYSLSYTRNGASAAAIAFANTSQLSVEWTPSGTKTLTRGTEAMPMTAGQFTFELYEGDSASGAPLQSTTNQADGSFTFQPVVLTSVGAHTFTVKERAGTNDNITYDAVVYTATVDVNMNAANTGLEIGSVTYQAGGERKPAIRFANQWAASVDVPLTASKLLNGSTPAAEYDGAFTFELYEGDTVSGTPLQTKTNTGGTVRFDRLHFDHTGVYDYIVKERPGSTAGMTYDPREFHVVVTVTNPDGTLAAEVKTYLDDAPADLVFTNTTGGISVPLSARKLINGRPAPDNAEMNGKFSFELYDLAVSADEPAQVVSNHDGSAVAFAPLTFSAAGQYSYRIREVRGTDGNYNYDPAQYDVTITVRNTDGTLSADVRYILNGIPVNSVIFNNRTVSPTDLTLTAGKLMDGQIPAEQYDGRFTFALYEGAAANGTPLQTKTNTRGQVEFDPIHYESVGEYTYTVVEKAGNDPNINYDPTVYTVKVTVINRQGFLEATAIYVTEDGVEPRMWFDNTTPEAAVWQPTAVKTVDGGTPAPRDNGAFTFELYEGTGNDRTLIQRVTNRLGSVVFDSLTYDQTGEHTYTIVEKTGDDPNMIYDATVYTVVVTVANVDGRLVATPLVRADGERVDAVRFNNETITTSIPVEKKWAEGAHGDEAVIELVRNGEATGQTVTLNERNQWKAAFADLPVYDENGAAYRYTVRERTSSFRYTVEEDGRGGFLVTNYTVPDTGDHSHPLFYGILLAVAAVGLWLTVRKRRAIR